MARPARAARADPGAPGSARLTLADGVLRHGSVPILRGVSEAFAAESVDPDATTPARSSSPAGRPAPAPAAAASCAVLGFDHVEDGVVLPLSRHVLRLASSVNCARFVACARCKLWWMTPTWGDDDPAAIPAETQFLLLQLRGADERTESGLYAAFVPMISRDGFRSTLSGDVRDARDAETAAFASGAQRKSSPSLSSASPSGSSSPLALVCESGCDEVTTRGVRDALVIAVSSSPFAAISACVATARGRMGTFKLRVEKRSPDLKLADRFGWCTWDAFYHAVTPAGIEAGIRSLAAGGTPARFVIIDDGWQSVAPDAAFRKKFDHIADFPVAKRPRKRPRASAPAAFGAGAAAGGVAQWAGAATAAWLESAYWHGIHASPYGGRAWRALRFLGRRVLGGAIRLAVSTLSCFNHRVSAVQANVKFQRPPPDEDDSSEEEEEEEDDGRRPIVAADKKRKRGRRFRGDNNPASGTLASSSPLDALSTASDGLATVVGRIKALGVDRVYCWHALFGYWGGLHPKMPGVRKFGPPVLKTPTHTPGVYAVEPSQAWDPITLGGVGVVPSASLARFYAELHAYLAAAGVDGIKVDGQAVVGGLGAGVGGGPALARETHAALERSVETYFPENGLINCMCHSSENILNFSESNLARVSDDFYPTNGASHTVHVANVAYNSAFMGEIVVPDWDMFQSHCGEAGAMHAAARAVGGCPVYVSDAPGKHDHDLLSQLVFASGKTLRAREPGRPTRDCLFRDVCRDGVTALKVWNVNACAGVVGCFNLQGAHWSREKGVFARNPDGAATVVARVKPADVEPFREGHEPPEAFGSFGGDVDTSTGVVDDDSEEGSSTTGAFAVRAHGTRETARLANARATVDVALGPKGWEVFTIAPVRRVDGVEFAPLALDRMFNGGGAIERVAFSLVDEATGEGEDDDAATTRRRKKTTRGGEEAPKKPNATRGGQKKRSPTKTSGPSPRRPRSRLGVVRVYGCGALACYSSRAPDAVAVDGSQLRGTWAWSDRDGALRVPLGPREDAHEVRIRFGVEGE